jgi:glutamate-5-semialdehyde dehydrogenase
MTTIDLRAMGQRAKAAAQQLAIASTEQKNAALGAMADALMADAPTILDANRRDLDEGRATGLSDALLDRISLAGRLDAIADDVRKVADLPDPVGVEFAQNTLANGLKVCKRRTPLGVIGVIYEARPNVTVDVAALALKSGNAVIMRGGKEILHSNAAIIAALSRGLAAYGLPADSFQSISSTDRAYIGEMLKLHDYIDMIIPRGGAALHQFCRENSTIPVITGGLGVVHIYVDASARQDDALAIIHNAKTQRPSVCNTVDTVLVHQAVAPEFLPRLVEHLGAAGVSFRAEPRALAMLTAELAGDAPPLSARYPIHAAGPEDFDTEWMALILGMKVVEGLDDAIAHIRAHSTLHSEAILTEDADHAARFLNEVDAAAVFWNASTRFNDGGALGLGAEVAVSTQKLHARGPMALEELTTYKWVVIGTGQVRER